MAYEEQSDIRRRALRAAAKVALLGAGFGCGAAPTTGLQGQAAPEPEDSGVARADGGAGLDAGVVVVSDAGIVDSGLSDAGLEVCDSRTLSAEEYLECCERIGWDWDRGCAAWGPPAPPVSRVTRGSQA